MKALDIFEKSPEGEFSLRLNKGQRILFVGRSGSGKSAALMSFPKELYEFDIDNRFRGAASAIRWLGVEEFRHIEFDFYNPKDGFDAIDAKLNQLANDIESKKSKVQTIGFESVGALIFLLVLDSQRKRGIKGTGSEFKGKVRGKVEFLHPDDYNYCSTALRLIMFNYIFPLNEMGVNTIFSAWIADKWGKAKNAKEFDPPEVIGEKILGPGNMVEEFTGYFDESYYFRKNPALIAGKQPKYTVEFNGSFAKTAYPLQPGEIDVTGKSFYPTWKELVETNLKVKETIA